MLWDCLQHFRFTFFLPFLSLPFLLTTLVKKFSPVHTCAQKITKDLIESRGQMVTPRSPNHYCLLKIRISDCYGNEYKMLDGYVLRDHG